MSSNEQWEYEFLDTNKGFFGNSKIKGQLLMLGKQGWEAVGLSTLTSGSVVILLKRKIKE